jgi:putative FmdB family regulatory protein
VPTYQYACTECGHAFDQFQSFSDDALTECPECQGRLRKLFNAVGVVFKGSGFYRTDSRKDGGKDGGKDGTKDGGKVPAAAGNGSGTKADATGSSGEGSGSTGSSNASTSTGSTSAQGSGSAA